MLDYFEPENYQLTLNINKQTERVRGKVMITGEPKADTIKFHAKDLKISSVTVNEQSVEFSQEGDILETKLEPSLLGARPKNLSPQTFRRSDSRCRAAYPLRRETLTSLKIDFSFDLNRNMEGAYLSVYKYKGKEQKLVTTQFESHYARQCFPCIDEPAAKATFDLKIISHDPDDTIISNMPAKREEVREVPTFNLEAETLDMKNTNRQKIVEFETTPKMSTYLLAFCVGHFQ